MISHKSENKLKFYVKIFPSTEFDWDCIKIDSNKNVLYVRHLFEVQNSLGIRLNPKFWCFKTDGIFLNSCQRDIYESIVDHMVEELYGGIDNVVMSYGQNYSGKTFTMSGLHNQFEQRGMIPRIVTDLFRQQKVRQNHVSSKIWMSVIDIHGNLIYDLMSSPRKVCKRAKDVQKVELKSELNCLELLFQAEARRKLIDQKSYNAHSGSHIVTFILKLVSLNSQRPCDKFSKVHFIDLAGVETIQRNPLTSSKDQREQGCANLTKTLMEIFALRSKKYRYLEPEKFSNNRRIHILTQYLGKSFSPISRIKLICHIRPNHEDLMITLSILKFGLAFQGIPMLKPQPHIESNYDRYLETLKEQIKSLEDELLIRNLSGKLCPMKISQDRIIFVERAVLSFLKGDISEYELITMVDDFSLILNIIKGIRDDKHRLSNASVALQTDFDQEFISRFTHSLVNENFTSRQINVDKGRKSSIASTRHVSFKKLESSTDKGAKAKTKVEKGKGEEKLTLKSEEVQVNLIEPYSELPKLDSREGFWAAFLISRQDIQAQLDKLNADVTQKHRKLNTDRLKCDSIRHSLETTQLTLNQLATVRYFDGKDLFQTDTKLIMSEEESKLIKKLTLLQKELATKEQKLINAQTDWLEALEKLTNEKKNIEEEFKQFCQSKNLFVLNLKMSSENVSETRNSGSLLSHTPCYLVQQENYNSLQNKYIFKFKLSDAYNGA